MRQMVSFGVEGRVGALRSGRDDGVCCLPGVIGGAVGGGDLGAGVDVVDAGFGLVDGGEGVALDGLPGVGAVGEGVDGHGFEVAGPDEVVEGLGGFLFVDGVGVDGGADGVEVFAEDGFAGVADVFGVGGDGEGGEDADDDHDDHEFEEGEAGGGAAGRRGDWFRSEVYHVLYFVPSRPVPGLLVWMSKTFCPPKESESGSSWLERRPQSVELVMGSVGILRRKRTFLPWISTPSTRVWRSGG